MCADPPRWACTYTGLLRIHHHAVPVPPLDDPQLALSVDRQVRVIVVEQRGNDLRELGVGPLGERDARLLAALLLGRATVPADDGPWRGAVAGGTRTVQLEP